MNNQLHRPLIIFAIYFGGFFLLDTVTLPLTPAAAALDSATWAALFTGIYLLFFPKR